MEKTFREVFFNPPQNALTFKTKLFCVSTKTPLRLTPNSLTFECKRKGIFSKNKIGTINSCISHFIMPILIFTIYVYY